MESVQDFVKGIEGVKEIRPMEGKLLERATLYLEGSPRVSNAPVDSKHDQKPAKNDEEDSKSVDDIPEKQAGHV